MGLGFQIFFNLVLLWVILSWEIAEFSCYSSVSLGRGEKNKTHTSCLIQLLKRAIKHWWHASSVKHIFLEAEAKWDWYLPKHLARKEFFARLNRETVPLKWRVRIFYINVCDFSFHAWPKALFFITTSSSSIIFLLVGENLQKYCAVHFNLGSDHQTLIEWTFTQPALITLNVLVLYFWYFRYLLCEYLVSAGSTTA